MVQKGEDQEEKVAVVCGQQKTKSGLEEKISCSAMQGKWKYMLYILQKFLTYEGHYSLTFLYHIHLLLHSELGKLINFPYFLLRSLEKMSKGVQRGKMSQVTC